MATDSSDGHSLIQQFLASLSLRQMEQCGTLLASLQLRAQEEQVYAPWCLYLAGILANERDHDWAQAERIFHRLLQADALEPALQGRVLIALGLTYEYQGRWSEAIRIYEHSLALFAERQQVLDQVKVHKNIAIAYRKGYTQGHFGAEVLPQAVAGCQRALDHLAALPDSWPVDVAWLKGSILNTLGIIYLSLGQWDDAIACYEQDLTICRRLDDLHGMGLSRNNLGEVYQRRGQAYWPQAEQAYQQALTLIGEFGNPYEETDILANLGSLYRAMGAHARALTCYTQALARIESLRAAVTSEEARTGFFTTVVDIYANTVQLLLEADAVKQAFDTVERARSRAFVELLAQQAIRPSPQVPAVLLQQEQLLRAQLGELYAASEGPTEQTRRLEQRLDEIQRQVRLLDAEYAAFHTVDPLTHEQIQARLPAATALLSYFTTGDHLFAFVVTRDELTVHALSLTTQALARVFDANGHLHRLLPDANGRLHQPWLLERLYQSLIAPLAPYLRAQRALWIVPHGVLHYVPFHALAYGDADGLPRTLLDDYEILYAPSATVLLEYCQRKPTRAARRGLAVGYNETDLHHAEAEAMAIAGLFGGAALAGRKATRKAVLRQAQHKRWLHFSCHGRFNTHAPLTSHLLLADGPLYVADVLRDLQLQAELVTLSACETGRSQVLKGDELIGLVRAFIYAGAPSVLVSLWPVAEISTRILMEHFYRAILAGQTKPVALRTAQQTLRALSVEEVESTLAAYGEPDPARQVEHLRNLTGNEQIFAHPYFWAAFVLVGDRVTGEAAHELA